MPDQGADDEKNKKSLSKRTDAHEKAKGIFRSAETLNKNAAARRERDYNAFSPVTEWKQIPKAMKDRFTRNVETSLLGTLGVAGEAIFQSRRADVGQKWQAAKNVLKLNLMSSLGGGSVIGEYFANKLSNSIDFSDDPHQQNQNLKVTTEAISHELLSINNRFKAVDLTVKNLHEQVQKIEKNEDDKSKESVKRITEVEKSLQENAQKVSEISQQVEQSFSSMARDITAMRKHVQGIDERVSSLEKNAANANERKGSERLRLHRERRAERLRNKDTFEPATFDNKQISHGEPFARRVGRNLGRRTLGVAGKIGSSLAGAVTGGLGRAAIGAASPYILGSLAIGALGYGAYRYFKGGPAEASAAPPTQSVQPIQPVEPIKTDPSETMKESVRLFAQRKRSQFDTSVMIERNKREEDKKNFMLFGKMPSGFEFMQGHMGRLGSAEAVAATGAMPLQGGGFNGTGTTGAWDGSGGGSYFPGTQGVGPPSPEGTGIPIKEATLNKSSSNMDGKDGRGPLSSFPPSSKALTGGATVPKNTNAETLKAINEVAKQAGVDPAAIAGVIKTESNWNTRNRTGKYNGLTQIGKETFEEAGGRLGGMTYDQFRIASSSEQIKVYGDWLKHYKFTEKFSELGIDIKSMTPARQAAILQAFQFAPNAKNWKEQLARGNVDSPSTHTKQASALKSTSIRDMEEYYGNLLKKNPAEYKETKEYKGPGIDYSEYGPGDFSDEWSIEDQIKLKKSINETEKSRVTPIDKPNDSIRVQEPEPSEDAIKVEGNQIPTSSDNQVTPVPVESTPITPEKLNIGTASIPPEFGFKRETEFSTDFRNQRRTTTRRPGEGGRGGEFNYALTPEGMKEFGTPGYVKMERLKTASGKSYNVNPAVASQIKSFMDTLEKGGYKIDSVGGHAHRQKAGGGGLSTHATGTTIDINPTQNPFEPNSPHPRTDMPENVEKIAWLHGMSWGARFGDSMHFEQMSPAIRRSKLNQLVKEGMITEDEASQILKDKVPSSSIIERIMGAKSKSPVSTSAVTSTDLTTLYGASNDLSKRTPMGITAGSEARWRENLHKPTEEQAVKVVPPVTEPISPVPEGAKVVSAESAGFSAADTASVSGLDTVAGVSPKAMDVPAPSPDKPVIADVASAPVTVEQRDFTNARTEERPEGGSRSSSESTDARVPQGGGRYNPESEDSKPGSSSYGSSGRCFV